MTDANPNLEPIEPSTARELFIQHKKGECAESTVQSYDYHLNHFIKWCDQEDISNMNVLTGRDLQQFR